MLTLRQLYSKTDQERKERSRFVKIVKTKMGHNKQGLGYIAAQTYSTHKVNEQGKLVRNSDPHRHLTMITFLNNKLQCIVNCSCEDYTYRYESVNSYKGAAKLDYSNGDPPVFTNPAMTNALCKHAVALYLKIQPKLPSGH